MTPKRNSNIQSNSNSPPKHPNLNLIRNHSNLSTPQTNRKRLQTSNLRIKNNSSTRSILYYTSSIRIYRSRVLNSRLSIWFILLHSHRISRTTCNNWNNLPINLLNTTNPKSFLANSSFRIRSCRLILTLCRRSMTIPIHYYLLMR